MDNIQIFLLVILGFNIFISLYALDAIRKFKILEKDFETVLQVEVDGLNFQIKDIKNAVQNLDQKVSRVQHNDR